MTSRTEPSPTESREDEVEPRLAGLVAFARERKRGNREKILSCALSLVSEHGYHDVSVEQIAAAAQVSRPTFYRHFAGKAEVAVQLYQELTAIGMPRRLAIRDRNYRDPAVVSDWIRNLFDADRSEQRLHQVFAQALVENSSLTQPARETIANIIRELGAKIPAFALDPDDPRHRKRWLEAYLLLFEILDQSSHAALDSGFANDPLIIDILTERFLAFVRPAP